MEKSRGRIRSLAALNHRRQRATFRGFFSLCFSRHLFPTCATDIFDFLRLLHHKIYSRCPYVRRRDIKLTFRFCAREVQRSALRLLIAYTSAKYARVCVKALAKHWCRRCTLRRRIKNKTIFFFFRRTIQKPYRC